MGVEVYETCCAGLPDQRMFSVGTLTTIFSMDRNDNVTIVVQITRPETRRIWEFGLAVDPKIL